MSPIESHRRPYLLATRSTGKLREIRDLLAPYASAPHALDVIDLSEAGVEESPAEEAIEAFETFEENALAKADYFHRLTGLPTLADDSGLAIHALGGAPGVRSKRWSGRTDLSGPALDAANNAKLVVALEALPPNRPLDAEYVCAAAFRDGEQSIVTLGRASGTMLTAPRGNGGFGYDPYFFSNELRKTFGEASLEEKHLVSHRGRAFSALLERLLAGLPEGPADRGEPIFQAGANRP